MNHKKRKFKEELISDLYSEKERECFDVTLMYHGGNPEPNFYNELYKQDWFTADKVNAKDFEIQDIRWQIDFYIGNHEYKKAEKLYKVLEEKIDMKNPYNKQYIKELEFVLYYEIENKFYQKGIERLSQS